MDYTINYGRTFMKLASRFVGLTILSCGLWSSAARADVLAEYIYDPGPTFNPNTQGWTLGETTEEDVNFFSAGGVSLLIQREEQSPNVLFTETVPTNVFFDAWSFTGRNRFAGNSQEEMGQFMFVDDGTNLWHMSFYNHGNDDYDGIYMGGDPEGPVLGVTATKVWAEVVGGGPGGSPTNKPFDGFHEWALVDADGTGGAPPTVQLNGENLELLVPIISAPSMFPAGTIGWGSINVHEVGFFQTTHMVFDGNPDAEPPVGLPGDFNADQAVNAADFVVWRKNLGAADETALNGNGDGMNGVDPGDRALWRTNFGRLAEGGSGSTLGAVPEPHSVALLVAGIAGALTIWRRSLP
jgi:hypothetical protein